MGEPSFAAALAAPGPQAVATAVDGNIHGAVQQAIEDGSGGWHVA